MKSIKTKLKIWSLTTLMVLIATFGLAAIQNKIIGVSAQIDPIEFMGPDVDFGIVFPQQILEKKFYVIAALEYPNPISYALVTQNKPRPDFANRVGWSQASKYCIDNPRDYEKCYPLLCPYLDISSRETEGDRKNLAKLKEPFTDQVDYWKVVLKTPPIKGNVGQNFTGLPVDSAGEYGCDIKLVLLETVGGEIPPSPVAGGYTPGGYAPGRGPVISDSKIFEQREEDNKIYVIITWRTDYPATSRVIYDTISHPILGSPPNYGYAFSTPEQDQDPRVTFHAVRIGGLAPETTYYYRTVSRASAEQVSSEYSFTTLRLGGIEKEIEEEKPIEEIIPEIPEKIMIRKITPAPVAEREELVVSEEIGLPGEEIISPKEKGPERGLASMVAAIGTVVGEIPQSAWKIIVAILGLIGLVLIGIREWKRIQEKKKLL